MMQTWQTHISTTVCMKFWANYYVIIHTCCWESRWSQRGSSFCLSLVWVMKVLLLPEQYVYVYDMLIFFMLTSSCCCGGFGNVLGTTSVKWMLSFHCLLKTLCDTHNRTSCSRTTSGREVFNMLWTQSSLFVVLCNLFCLQSENQM